MHIGAAIMFVFLVGVVVNIRVKRLGQYAPTYELRMPDLLNGLNHKSDDYSPFGESDDEDVKEEEIENGGGQKSQNKGDGHMLSPATFIRNSNVV